MDMLRDINISTAMDRLTIPVNSYVRNFAVNVQLEEVYPAFHLKRTVPNLLNLSFIRRLDTKVLDPSHKILTQILLNDC